VNSSIGLAGSNVNPVYAEIVGGRVVKVSVDFSDSDDSDNENVIPTNPPGRNKKETRRTPSNIYFDFVTGFPYSEARGKAIRQRRRAKCKTTAGLNYSRQTMSRTNSNSNRWNP
jgi:hypothetical protein